MHLTNLITTSGGAYFWRAGSKHASNMYWMCHPH